MFSKAVHWFKALSMVGKVGVISLLAIGIVAATSSGSQPKPQTTNLTPAKSVSQPPSPKIEHKTVTTTEEIPFTSSTVDDGSLAQGTSKVTTAGVNGVRTHTYDVVYTDGTETSRTEVSNEVTTPPVNQVTTIGTYVYVAPQPSCPNGTYVNTAGNTVCRPYASSTVPVGATARCVDGTYSFSQSRSGTCSHHGGVAAWL